MINSSHTYLLSNLAAIGKSRYFHHMISGTQSKMARAALGWTAKELAQRADVGVMTVSRFEAGVGETYPAIRAALERALEAAGIEFIPENGGGAGVRMRKSKASGVEMFYLNFWDAASAPGTAPRMIFKSHPGPLDDAKKAGEMSLKDGSVSPAEYFTIHNQQTDEELYRSDIPK